MSSFTDFAFLIATAIAYYFAGKLILAIAAFVLALQGWLFFCRRFPRSAIFIYGFCRGLFGGRRRRW